MYCDIPLLGRCCFCMPLRRGVLTFGYLNTLFSAFMVGIYSYHVHNYGFSRSDSQLVYHGAISPVPSELCIAMYCLDIVANVVMLYGAHRTILLYVKTFYYYTLATILATLLLQIIDWSTTSYFYSVVESVAFFFAGLMLQLYLLILVRSLINKLEVSALHRFDNPLEQIVSGEPKVETNVVDNNIAPV